MSYLGPIRTQTRTPVLVFLKAVGPPIVLYVDNTEDFYKEMIDIVKNANEKAPKLIEKKANGPVKTLAILDTQISAVAIQEELMVDY